MYTSRICKWGIEKNYKAKEKDILIARITEALANGQDVSCMTFRDRGIKHHCILKHMRSKMRELAQNCNSLPSKPPLRCSANDQRSPGVEPKSLSSSGPATNTGHFIRSPAQTVVFGDRAVATVQRPQPRRATVCNGIPNHGMLGMEAAIFPFSLSQSTPGGVLLHATRTFFNAFSEKLSSIDNFSPESVCNASTSHDVWTSHTSDIVRARSFWHNFDTAVYLLTVNSLPMGWTAFHAVWGTAAEALLCDLHTLLRRLITISNPGYLGQLPELRQLILKFIADLLHIKLGESHPLAQICRQLLNDDVLPRMSEAALLLLRKLFEQRLGPHHHETFESQLALVVCQRRNRDLHAAERSARELLQRVRLPGARAMQNGQFFRAMRSLIHILKEERQYEEAITLCHQILDQPPSDMWQKQWIYTKEDLAELHRLQGNVEMESLHLYAALQASQKVFGHGAAPTLHIWDKLQLSLEDQGRSKLNYGGGVVMG